MNKKFLILSLTLFLLLTNTAISKGFSYWDKQSDTRNEVLPIGDWSFITQPISGQVATDLSSYIDSILATDPNSPLQYIYSQSGKLDSLTATIEDISVYNQVWDFTGIGTDNPADTMGYVSLIDRSKDSFNDPIHDILPIYTTTPPYPEYNYFTAYDVENTVTSNQYSLRLNYGATMTTNTTISNVTSLSFYAARGLTASNDSLTMSTNRAFYVYISTDGINWIQIGSDVPIVPSGTTATFLQYNYSIPSQYLNQSLFLRINYDGAAIKSGKVREYSRLVIDELIITTDN